jgi:hypothetical protein
LPAFPDAELVMLDLLAPMVGGATVTHTDENLTAPCIQVQRIGGPNDGVTDQPTVQTSCFGATRQQAWELSRQVEQVVLAATGTAVTGDYVTGVLIDSASTQTAICGVSSPCTGSPTAAPGPERPHTFFRSAPSSGLDHARPDEEESRLCPCSRTSRTTRPA